jgi:hypothetical protein
MKHCSHTQDPGQNRVPPDAVASAEEGGGWDMDRLLDLISIPANNQRSLRKTFEQTSVKAAYFRAWLSYGYANKTSAERKDIDAPGLFALRRYVTQPDRAALTLARLSPQILNHQIQRPHDRIVEPAEAELLNALAAAHFGSLLDSLMAGGDPHARID